MTMVLVPVLVATTYLVGLGVGEAFGVASADLVLLVVVAAALARGTVTGALVGFTAGLLLDVAPGSTAPVGTAALGGTLAGLLLGLLAQAGTQYGPPLARSSRPWRGVVAALATAAALSTLAGVHGAVGAVLGVVSMLPDSAGTWATWWSTSLWPTLVSATGTVVVGAIAVPGLITLLAARNGCRGR